MASKRNVDMSANTDTIKIVAGTGSITEDQAVPATDPQTDDTAVAEPTVAKKAPAVRARSKKYVNHRSQVDKTRLYDSFAAIELVKKLSYSKFEGTITLDGVTREVGPQTTVTLPHSTGKSIRVAIASDEVIAAVEAGNIEFDVLVSSPVFMPKLAKLARTLGPKGLMPNPKNGTLTPNPEAKKKELEKGALSIKTEKKAPVIHISIGKTSMESKELVDNLNALLMSLKGRLQKASISASMSPSVKVQVVG